MADGKERYRLDPRSWSLTTLTTTGIVALMILVLAVVVGVTIRSVQTTLSQQLGETFAVQAEGLGDLVGAYFLEKVSQVQALGLVELVKEEVVEQNADYMGSETEILAEIEALDQRWVAAADDDPFIQQIITSDPAVNPVAFQLKAFAKGFPDHVEMFVTDRYGATLAATNRLSDYYQADEAWWQAAWNEGHGAVYISEPEFDESAGITAFLVAVPIVSEESEEVIGIVRSTVVLGELFGLLADVRIGETGHALLFNRAAEVLFDPLASDEERGSAGLSPTVRQHIISSGSHFMVAQDQHQDQVIFGHGAIHILEEGTPHHQQSNPDTHGLETSIRDAVTNLGWVTVVRQSSSEANARVNRVVFNIVLANLLGIIFIGLVLGKAGQIVMRPLRQLETAAAQVGGGNLETPLPTTGQAEIGRLIQSFKTMVRQLREAFITAERRAQQLETVATLNEQLSAILEFDQLLHELVNQVQARFRYYHAHVYLIDVHRQRLVVAAGSGQAGEQMKAKQHSIPLDAPTSLVARAARTVELVSIDNVRTAPDWLPNPLLPDTHAEMAVPIVLDRQVVGVLDVQNDAIASLTEGDANLLRALANQVATAIRNVRLFDEVKTALAEAQALQERYRVQAWDRTRIAPQVGTYLYRRSDAPDLPETVLASTRQQAIEQPNPTTIRLSQAEPDGNKVNPHPVLIAPVTLSGKPIGALQIHQADRSADEQPWAETDLSLVQAILDQVAQTAENLRLFDETRQQASQEQTIREITDKLRTATSLDDLVKTVATELGDRLAVGHAIVDLDASLMAQQGSDPTVAENGSANGHIGAEHLRNDPSESGHSGSDV